MKTLSVVLACMVFALVSSASVILVTKQGKLTSINVAIKKAKAGDTIRVESGTYFEKNILIDKPLSLLGKNYPTLDGEKKFEIVSIKSGNVVIDGFRIIHSGYGTLEDPGGIKVYNGSHVVISNNILDDNFFGIYLQHCSKTKVYNNRIVSYGIAEQEIGNGIHCWKSTQLEIYGNSIEGHRDGIYFEFVTHSKIQKNISKKNIRYGLHFMFSNDDSYIGNTFKKNGAGVAVMFTNRVKMIDNHFEENWGDAAYGLLLKEISDSYISGNSFIRNTTGIYLEGANRIIIEKNKFQFNGWGMKIQASCIDNTIRSNNFIGNTFDVTTNGSLVLNTFDENFWDRYEGYDLNKDGIGDVPYHPLSLFSVIVEQNPPAMILFRSFMVSLLDKSEKMIPSLTPDNFIDNKPRMKHLTL